MACRPVAESFCCIACFSLSQAASEFRFYIPFLSIRIRLEKRTYWSRHCSCGSELQSSKILCYFGSQALVSQPFPRHAFVMCPAWSFLIAWQLSSCVVASFVIFDFWSLVIFWQVSDVMFAALELNGQTYVEACILICG